MSASTTNIEKQAEHHKAPITGIVLAVIFGALMGAAITWTATSGDDPEGAAVQIDGRTGDLDTE